MRDQIKRERGEHRENGEYKEDSTRITRKQEKSIKNVSDLIRRVFIHI